MHALFRTFLPRILVSYFHYGKKTERINLFISCYNTFQKLESEAFYNRAKCNPNNPNSNLDKSTLTLNEWYSFGIQNYKNGVVKPSTIQNYCCIHAILSNIFEIAVQDDLIVKNPCCHTYFLPFCMTAMQFIEFRSAYFNFVSEWYHIEF